MNNNIDRFIDEYLNVHIKGKQLGRGGQGVVFRTRDPDIAVKLVTDNNGNPITDQTLINRYSQRLKNIRLLPLPNGVNLSVPAALLKDKVGYVMQLLSDMAPFSSFWLDGRSTDKIEQADIPEWLYGMQEDPAKQIVHYRNTGGLRRRLIALCKCSGILARLHGNGLVYGDISPANVYLSDDHSKSEVWLIDADNLRFEIVSGGSAIYTPKYGAPELVRGLSGGRPGTDCHAFAVMAFYLLTMIHPFAGDLVEGGGERDWADDDANMEEKANEGHLPWVDDIKDDSNSTLSGLPRELVLTEKLAVLFERTFGDGRTCFWKRPAIYHWPEALADASDKTIICPSCKMSYFFFYTGDGEGICPYCNAKKPETLLIQSFPWNGKKELGSLCWSYAREIPKPDTPVIVPERLFKHFSITSGDNLALKIFFDDHRILIVKPEECNLKISVGLPNENGSAFKRFISQIQLPTSAVKTGFWLYADEDEPRIIKCSIMAECE